jgi:hypothetical protein
MEQTLCVRNVGILNSDAGELPRRKHTTNGVVFDNGFYQLLDFLVLGCYILATTSICISNLKRVRNTLCTVICTCMFNCRAAGLVDLDCEQKLLERHCSSHDW